MHPRWWRLSSYPVVGPEETNPWGLYTGLVRLSISAIEGLVRLSFSAQQLGAHALKGRRAAVLLREGLFGMRLQISFVPHLVANGPWDWEETC